MFLATTLMLQVALAAIQLLNLVLQKAGGSLFLADILACLEKTINSLDQLKVAMKFCLMYSLCVVSILFSMVLYSFCIFYLLFW